MSDFGSAYCCDSGLHAFVDDIHANVRDAIEAAVKSSICELDRAIEDIEPDPEALDNAREEGREEGERDGYKEGLEEGEQSAQEDAFKEGLEEGKARARAPCPICLTGALNSHGTFFNHYTCSLCCRTFSLKETKI